MSALSLSALLVVALATPSGEPPPKPDQPNASALDASARYEVDMGAPVLTGLVPSSVVGTRIVDRVSGEVRSLPELLEAAGRTDLLADFYARVSARWLFIGAGAVAGLGGLAALGILGASTTLGVPAGLPWTQAGVGAIAAATAISGITTAAVFGVLGFAIKPLPVGEADLERMAAKVDGNRIE